MGPVFIKSHKYLFVFFWSSRVKVILFSSAHAHANLCLFPSVSGDVDPAFTPTVCEYIMPAFKAVSCVQGSHNANVRVFARVFLLLPSLVCVHFFSFRVSGGGLTLTSVPPL